MYAHPGASLGRWALWPQTGTDCTQVETLSDHGLFAEPGVVKSSGAQINAAAGDSL